MNKTKLQRKLYKELVKESYRGDLEDLDSEKWHDSFENTKPKYDTSPEEALLHKIYAASDLRKKFAGKSAKEIAEILGFDGDEKIISLIDNMMTSPYYDIVTPTFVRAYNDL
jgi:hypothetical protein